MLGTICLQCGDRGFANAFVYCVKCLDVAVHRYCLDVIPETFEEFVHWVCDDCEVGAQNLSSIHEHDAIPCKKRDCTVTKNSEGFSGVEIKKNDIAVVDKEEHVYEGGAQKSYDACKKLALVECAESATERSPMQLGEINEKHDIPLAADERKSCQQSSSQQLKKEKAKNNLMQHAKSSDDVFLKDIMKKKRNGIKEFTMEKDQNRLGNTSSKQSHEECANINISERASLASDSAVPTKVKENKGSVQRDQRHVSWKPCESDSDPGTAEHPILSCNGSLKSSKKKRTLMSAEDVLQEQMHRNGSAQPNKENKGLNFESHCADVSTEGGFSRSTEHVGNRDSEHREKRTSTLQPMVSFCKDLSKDLNIPSAEPVIMPSWRGNFKIWNKNHDILGLRAHMSSKACQKVYEATCQFQSVLHLEMLPKSAVWPKSFETSEPSGENIALYFFPCEISQRVFDHLVDEMMREELALKAFVQNAELLIFTSSELPLLYWRFQGKYYLWGVFRGKQSPPSHSHPFKGETGDNPIIHADQPIDTGFGGGKIPVTMKSCDARSPLSPLSNSGSYGSGTS